MVELLDSKEIHSIESRMIALLDRTFLKSTKLDSVDYKKELPKNVKRWFGSKTFEIQLNNLITELIKFSLLYADSQMKILTAAKVKEGTILTKEAIARATDISENAAKSIIKMLEDDAIYYEGPAKLGRRIEDLWQGQRSKAVSFAHTFSADVATATTVYRYRQYGVQFMEFSAKIDERTTDQCRCLHHVVFDLSKQSVDAYRPPLHHNCICAGSLIKTLQGDVPIEHIRVGDMVFTTEGRYMPVTCIMSNIPDRIIEISTKNRTIKITPNHPILHFNNKSFGFVEWLEAGELGIGDVIVTLDGYERIQSILEAPIEQVYNISVQEDEDYVANGIYVHNCRSALLPIPNTREPQKDMIFENRDFSGTLDDPDAVKKVFKDIEKFNDKYRVSGFVIDQDLSTRIMFEKGVYVGIDTPIDELLERKVLKETMEDIPPTSYKPAQTIKEAEQWARENTPVINVDYKGLDIKTANAMNESLARHLELNPELASKMKYFGTSQAQAKLAYQLDIDDITEQFVKVGYDREKALELAKGAANKFKTSPSEVASYLKRTDDASGIAFNKNMGKSFDALEKRLASDVKNGFHPTGCDTVKSMVDHEFGHALDDIYDISNSPEVMEIFNSANADYINSSLSRYALTNNKEFVAEAWAEYLNNPAPREIAQKIGDLMMSKIRGGAV